MRTPARILTEQANGSESLEILFGLHSSAHTRGESRRAVAIANQMLVIARRIDTPRALAIAHYAQGLPRHYLGDLAGARSHYSLSIQHYREKDFDTFFGRVNPGVGALSWSGPTNCNLATLIKHCVTPMRRSRWPVVSITLFSVALALNVGNQIHSLRGNFERMLDNAGQMEA